MKKYRFQFIYRLSFIGKCFLQDREAAMKIVFGTMLWVILAFACARDEAWEKDQSAQKESGTIIHPQTATKTAEQIMTEAEEHWKKRFDRKEIEQAIAKWEYLCKVEPGYETYTKLSYAYYLYADAHVFADTDEQQAEHYLSTLDRGTVAGEKALMYYSEDFKRLLSEGKPVEEAVKAIDKGGVPAMFWYSTNLGRWAKTKGFSTILLYKNRVKSIMDHIISLDDSYFYHAPHRYMAAFYSVAPGFAGGDIHKAKEEFDLLKNKHPNHFVVNTLMAEVYATKIQDKELYQKLLQEVISGNPDSMPDIKPEQELEQRKAKAMMAQVDELF